ncbi:LuxR family transcriptional regulator [Burkholderia multivorans]|uniref:LuxR family transcriptional regulator n=1 Tax=Burkholderia multivorans TaxID=87883 RepID=UPI001C2383A8|nr:LuxR family transcriptional regulator [Burkholderia multivorans]MBU9435108.1 LuxR family transcriptional regulator [Burkholderia multivorans]
MKSLHEFEIIFACDSSESLTKALNTIARQYGFTSTLLGLKSTKAANYENAAVWTTYPAAWRKLYVQDKLHLVDPTVNHALHHLKPLLWNQEDFRTHCECMLYEQAAGYGLKAGITLPIHGSKGEFGLLSFASDSRLTRADMLASVSALTLTRDLAFECGLGLLPSDTRKSCKCPLTPRESECLKWLTNGKTSWEISKILICSEATVNFHVSNILKKLGVVNRQQAIAKSLMEGWVVV